MSATRSRKLSVAHDTAALLLGRVEHGDNNLIVSLFTEKLGKVSALARAARNSKRRFGGSLDSMHTLQVHLDEGQSELLTLREASLLAVRSTLVSSLSALQAAGKALRWIKHAAPSRIAEPMVWREIQRLLDALDVPRQQRPAELLLAESGLRLLSGFGWGLELERCVRCSRPCPPDKKAFISPAKGGLLCRQCGTGPIILSPEQRARMTQVSRGLEGELQPDDSEIAIDLTEQCLAAHANFADN